MLGVAKENRVMLVGIRQLQDVSAAGIEIDDRSADDVVLVIPVPLDPPPEEGLHEDRRELARRGEVFGIGAPQLAGARRPSIEDEVLEGLEVFVRQG